MTSRLQGMRSGRLYLDLREQRLFVSKKPVHLGPTALHVLKVMMQRPMALVTKDELIDLVWDGRAVTDAVITTAMREVRRAISDPARKPEFIETVRGRGYRFLKPVEEEAPASAISAPRQDDQPDAEDVTPFPKATSGTIRAFSLSIAGAALALLAALVFVGFDRGFGPSQMAPEPEGAHSQAPVPAPNPMSIAVLPFTVHGSAGLHEHFAAGMHDDLLTRLAKISDLKVISRTSVMKYQGSSAQVPQIARELGVASVIEGSIQRQGDRAKITVKLIDGRSDALVWAETYDRELSSSNLFETQANITAEIASRLQARITATEALAIRRVPTNSLPAYDAYYRGKVIFETTYTDDWMDRAIAAFDEALELDPTFVEALAAKARAQLGHFWYNSGSRDWISRADETLRRAESIAPDDPVVRIVRGYYHYWGFRDYDKAAALARQTIEIAPNMAQAWELLAYVSRRQGNFNETMSALEQAHSLDPLDVELATERLETYAPLGFYGDAEAMVQAARRLNPRSFDVANNEALMWRLRGQPQKSYDAMTDEVAAPALLLHYRRAEYAVLIGDQDLIDDAFSKWSGLPEFDAGSKRTMMILRAEAEFNKGDEAAARQMLNALAAEQGQAAIEITTWAPNGRLFPVDIPALMGDAEEVRSLVAAYEESAPTDFWQIQKHWNAIIEALARIGDQEAALDYMARYTATFGPQAFLRFTSEPALQGLRDHPQYRAMEAKMAAWEAPNRPSDWSPS